jgi:hypothetical protein
VPLEGGGCGASGKQKNYLIVQVPFKHLLDWSFSLFTKARVAMMLTYLEIESGR